MLHLWGDSVRKLVSNSIVRAKNSPTVYILLKLLKEHVLFNGSRRTDFVMRET